MITVATSNHEKVQRSKLKQPKLIPSCGIPNFLIYSYQRGAFNDIISWLGFSTFTPIII